MSTCSMLHVATAVRVGCCHLIKTETVRYWRDDIAAFLGVVVMAHFKSQRCSRAYGCRCALDERKDVGVLREHAAQVRVLLLQKGVGLLDDIGVDLALKLEAHGHSHEGADLLPEAKRALDGTVGSNHDCLLLVLARAAGLETGTLGCSDLADAMWLSWSLGLHNFRCKNRRTIALPRATSGNACHMLHMRVRISQRYALYLWTHILSSNDQDCQDCVPRSLLPPATGACLPQAIQSNQPSCLTSCACLQLNKAHKG